ncbi:MAG: hypothetical protein A2Y14_05160 [Verrucomicrobia bacterium GWF2_51_19]|nr:MAG: hypothetical protein A2Y14_05160 [Verrucomicrobia bacterium GWF2_51_19]
MSADVAKEDRPEVTSFWQRINVHSAVGYESEYVYEGAKQAGPSTQFELYGDYAPWKGTLRAGLWSNLPWARSHFPDTSNEFDFYGKYFHPITEMFTSEVGYKYAWMPNANTGYLGKYHEVNLGVIADVALSPKAEIAYNIDKQQYKLQFSACYVIDLADYIVEKLSLEWSFYGGMLWANNAYGGARGKRKNDYIYAGSQADLVYKINELSDVRFGIRYAMNNDGCAGVANDHGTHDKLFWLGGSFNLYF